MQEDQSLQSVHWADHNYRVAHHVIRLDSLMLDDAYEKIIDGKIVLFDRDYVKWRLARLLAPFDNEQINQLLKETLDGTELRHSQSKETNT